MDCAPCSPARPRGLRAGGGCRGGLPNPGRTRHIRRARRRPAVALDAAALTLVGVLAGILILSGWGHQIFHGYRTKRLRDVSKYLLMTILAGAALWIVYGLETGDMYVVGTNAAAIALMGVIIAMKRRYDRASRLRERNRIEEMAERVRSRRPVAGRIMVSRLLADAVSSARLPSAVRVEGPDRDAELYCDPGMLRMVLVNLITNAADAMGGSGAVRVSSERLAGGTVVRVRDDGPGIPPGALSRAFETAFTTKATGTGMGLPYCRLAAELHGGSVSASSNPTVISIMLPDEGAREGGGDDGGGGGAADPAGRSPAS